MAFPTDVTELRVLINGTDYGAGGLGTVQRVTFQPGGPGEIGRATIEITVAGGGGYTFLDKQPVKIYRYNLTTNKIDRRYFWGFLSVNDSERLINTTQKEITLIAQDLNIQLQRLVGYLDATITIAAGTFAAQIASVVSQLQAQTKIGYTPTDLINATTYVNNLTGATTLPARTFTGRSLGAMIKEICDEAQNTTSSLRPAYHLGIDRNAVPSATFGSACLYVFDRASTPAATVAYSDNPSGSERGIAGWKRHIDGTTVIDWRQQTWTDPATGAITIHTDRQKSSAVADNTFDGDKAFKGDPLEDTESTSATRASKRLTRKVAATKNPRETVNLTPDPMADDQIYPGDFDTATWSLDGLSAALYQVAGVETTLDVGPPNYPDGALTATTITLGQRKLVAGDNPEDDEALPPIITDRVPPGAPSSLTVTGNAFNIQNGLTYVDLSWTASPAADIRRYRRIQSFGGVGPAIIETVLLGNTTTSTVVLQPSTTYSFYVVAEDLAGNLSTPSNSVTGTADPIPNPAAPTSLAGAGYALWSGEGRIDLSFVASVDARDLYEVEIKLGTTLLPSALIDGTATRLTLRNLIQGRTYALRIRSVRGGRIVGGGGTYPGPWSTPNPTISVAVPVLKPIGPPPPSAPDQDTATGIEGWGLYQGSIAAVLSTAVGLRGAYTLAFTLPSTTAGLHTDLSTRFDATAGGVYNVRLFVQASTTTGTPTGYSRISWTDKDDVPISTTTITVPALTTAKQDILQQVTAPATAAFARLEVGGNSPASGTATIYWGIGDWTIAPATGDLIDGSVTTAKIADSAVTAAKLPHGTSFPGSPATGDRYTRTDLAYREFWYDGTHWLTNRAEQQLLLPGNTTTYSVSGTVPLRGQGPGNVKVKIKRVMWRGSVAATNDANSYWQLRLFRDNSGRGFVDAYDLTTAATGTTEFYLTGTADLVWDFSSLSRWGWQVNKAGATGTPGNLTLDSVVVEYYETP